MSAAACRVAYEERAHDEAEMLRASLAADAEAEFDADPGLWLEGVPDARAAELLEQLLADVWCSTPGRLVSAEDAVERVIAKLRAEHTERAVERGLSA